MTRLETEQTEQVQHDHSGLAKKERHVCSHCHSKRDASLMHTMAQKYPDTYRYGRGDVTRFGKEKWYCNHCPDDQGGLRSKFRHGGKREVFICSKCQRQLPMTERCTWKDEPLCLDCNYKGDAQ